jgi:hypothetical protein
VSYTHPISRSFADSKRKLLLKYPIRFSAGIQEETFLNFTQGKNQIRPYVSITIF